MSPELSEDFHWFMHQHCATFFPKWKFSKSKLMLRQCQVSLNHVISKFPYWDISVLIAKIPKELCFFMFFVFFSRRRAANDMILTFSDSSKNSLHIWFLSKNGKTFQKRQVLMKLMITARWSQIKIIVTCYQTLLTIFLCYVSISCNTQLPSACLKTVSHYNLKAIVCDDGCLWKMQTRPYKVHTFI